MEKKTKVLAMALAGALVVGLALSVGSCALRSAHQDEQPSQAAEKVEEQAPVSATLSAFERACSKDWKSDAGSLQLSKGMIIEKDAKGSLHVVTLSKVEEADAGKQTMINVTGLDESEQKEVAWTLVFDEASGVATLACDGFKVSKSYSENVSEGSISVSGLDEAYVGLIGGDVEPLRQALAAYMAKNVPQAKSASFDGEAFIDFNGKTVAGTFHADDSARTVLTVTYSGGRFTVSE